MDPVTLAAIIGAGSSLSQTGLNFLGSAYSSHKQYKYAVKLAKLQYNLQQKSLLESPTNTRQGLVNAGYNAMLPYLGGNMSNAPSVGLASAAGAPVESADSSISNAVQLAKVRDEIKNIQANTEATSSQSLLSQEQAKTEQSKRDLMEMQKMETYYKGMLTKKDVDYYDKEWAQNQLERLSRIRKNYMDAESNRISANAQDVQAATNKEWRPYEAQTSAHSAKFGSWSRVYGTALNTFRQQLGKPPI